MIWERKIVFSKLWVNGMALFPFIIIKRASDLNNPILLNHERIHLRQQVELLIIPFYIFYLLFYLFNLLRYQNHQKAYLYNPFEKEAYRNDQDLGYLKHRKMFSFLNYFR